jgi:hypothetical protein
MTDSIWYMSGDRTMPNSDDYVTREYKPGKPIDGDIAQVALAGEHPDVPPGRMRGREALLQGYPVETTHLPRAWQWPSSTPLDFLQYGFTLASPAFRAVVEAIEPNVHQWSPIQIFDKKKSPLAEHFICIAGHRVNCVDLDRTTGYLPLGDASWQVWKPGPAGGSQLVLSRAKVAGKHLWMVGDLLLSESMMVSGTLKQALEEQQLRGIRFREATSA